MKLFAIIAHTQVLENYGDSQKPYWKCKGGDAYWVANVFAKDAQTAQNMGLNVPSTRTVETRNSMGFIEFVNRIEVCDVIEATRRAAVDRTDDSIDPDVYFSFVQKAKEFDTYELVA